MRFPLVKWSILLLTPLLVCPLLLTDVTHHAPASRCAAVVLLMAVYW